ncbi:hypothetical protein [Halomonas sp. AOP42-B2-16]|uniref:hypothetical protein n=1 Tax=Halomonas sp. AOP42-B2-16 TaxID=3457673 RepID=UPI004034D6CE
MGDVHRYAMVSDKGEILQITSGPYRYVACDDTIDDSAHYVDVDNNFYLKELIALDKNVDGLAVTFAGLPEGLEVKTNGVDTITDSAPLVIEYDVPGTYTISFSGLVNYLDHQMEVTVG